MFVYRRHRNRNSLYASYGYYSRQSVFLLWLSRCDYTYFGRWYFSAFYRLHFLSTLLLFRLGKNWNYSNHKFGYIRCYYYWNKLAHQYIASWRCVWYNILYKFNSDCNYYLYLLCVFLSIISIHILFKRILNVLLRESILLSPF